MSQQIKLDEDYLQKHNDFSIDSINATLHYYNDNGSKGVELKDENDLSMTTIIRYKASQDYGKVVGIADGSIEPIDISNWENLTYDEKVEAIGRYNADDSDAKKKYGSIVVDAIGKVE